MKIKLQMIIPPPSVKMYTAYCNGTRTFLCAHTCLYFKKENNVKETNKNDCQGKE